MARASAPRKRGNHKAGELWRHCRTRHSLGHRGALEEVRLGGRFCARRFHALRRTSPNFDLPTVVQDSTDYFVPTFTVPEDVTYPYPDGKGTVVLAVGEGKPSDSLTTQGCRCQ